MIDKNSLLNILQRIRQRKREVRRLPEYALTLDIMRLYPSLSRERIQAMGKELEADGLIKMGLTLNSEYYQLIEQ